jgi:L-asparaginase II
LHSAARRGKLNHLNTPPFAANAQVPMTAAPSPSAVDPVCVEVTRGSAVESRHRARYAVVDAGGDVILSGGDVQADVLPRSAVKPLQALPLVETGAADAFGVSPVELALACASHNGEPEHAAAVEAWLARIGCGEADLVCGGHMPKSTTAARALIAGGQTFRRVHDNCSGKHTGFLTLARHLGAPTQGYETVTHPVQQRILGVLETMTGLADLTTRPHGTDGCGIPALAMPLGNLALAMARLGVPDDQPTARQTACARVRAAMAAHAWYIAGTNSGDTVLMQRLAPRVLVKSGAEGVQAACLPEAGLGVAVKISDGGARAAQVVLGALLRRLDVLAEADADALSAQVAPGIPDRRGRTVGTIRPAGDLA